MKTRNKALALSLSAVLLVGASVFGTMAYLTSTEVVENTFTVGKVALNLDEAAVKPDGTYETDINQRVEDGNEYHLMPGHTYIKDPTVTVKENSESSYIRMKVTINEQADLDTIFAPDGLPLDTFFEGFDNNKWSYIGDTKDTANDARIYEFRYYKTVAAPTEDVKLEALFQKIKVPETVTGEQLETITDLKIKVVAEAIQADGFADDDAAWAAFDGIKQ